MTTTIEYRNSFHNTVCRVRVTEVRETSDGLQAKLSKRQQQRVQRELCGIKDCYCGGHANFWPALNDSGWCEGGLIVGDELVNATVAAAARLLDELKEHDQ